MLRTTGLHGRGRAGPLKRRNMSKRRKILRLYIYARGRAPCGVAMVTLTRKHAYNGTHPVRGRGNEWW